MLASMNKRPDKMRQLTLGMYVCSNCSRHNDGPDMHDVYQDIPGDYHQHYYGDGTIDIGLVIV